LSACISWKRRTSAAEARKSQSRVSYQVWLSSSSSGSRSPGRNSRKSTMRDGGESETAAIRSAYTKAAQPTSRQHEKPSRDRQEALPRTQNQSQKGTDSLEDALWPTRHARVSAPRASSSPLVGQQARGNSLTLTLMVAVRFTLQRGVDVHTDGVYAKGQKIMRKTSNSNQRINVVLPRETLAILDRVVPKGKRSSFISRALLHYVDVCGKQNLRQRLKQEALFNAERDLAIAAEWFPVEEEAQAAASTLPHRRERKSSKRT